MESMIVGKAGVIFGGKIQIKVGLSESGYATVVLSELVKPQKVGHEIEDYSTHGEQVYLSFNSIESLDVFREALDVVERALKDGVLPDKFGNYEVVKPNNK